MTIRLLEPVDATAVEALRKDAAAVLRFLGLPRRAAVIE